MSDERLKARSRSQIREAEHHRAVVLDHVQFHIAWDTYQLCLQSPNRMFPGTFANDVVNGFKREQEEESKVRRGSFHVTRLTPAQQAREHE